MTTFEANADVATATGAGEKTNSPAFCYVYRWDDRHKRKGAKCRILDRATARVVTVEFEDGVKIRITRNAVIRK